MDDRLILAKKLVSIGVESKIASFIALDAGSSQCVVNRAYLEDCNISKELIADSLDIITSFYCGDLVDDY
jgi:hypothetical protein